MQSHMHGQLCQVVQRLGRHRLRQSEALAGSSQHERQRVFSSVGLDAGHELGGSLGLTPHDHTGPLGIGAQ